MTFADAVNYLADGQAAKRGSWAGYVKKEVTSAADAAVETYTLTFVNRAGTAYAYAWDGTAFEPAPSAGLALDEEILAAMLATDWQTGDAAAFEAARSGGGTW